MINQGPFDQHFVISCELLSLLEWLANHEQENLKKLIHYAMQHGFTTKSTQAFSDTKELQDTIVNFLGLIDVILQETTTEDDTEAILQRSLIPAIKNIDAAMHDSSSIATSLARATQAVSAGRTAVNSKDVFCKELLKRWKPHKKAIIN